MFKDAREGASEMGKLFGQVPGLMANAERTLGALADMAQGGIRLDDATIARLAAAEAERTRSSRQALWVGAIALAVLAAVVALGAA